MTRTHIFLLFVLYLCSFATQAIQVPGLYEVEIPVPDQSERVRKEGLQTALRLVLIKLTGDSQATARTALQPLLKQAQSYLQQYRYREVAELDAEAVPVAPARSQTRLWVKFDENNLNQALRDLSVPVWGRERPSTLLWLTVADSQGRRLLGLEDGTDYIQAIDQRAGYRGIPLIYPLLDLDDSMALRASDIWGGFRQPVLEASSRYHTDAVLTAVLESPVSGIWEARWTAYIGQQTATWTTESDLLEAVFEEGVDKLADILASQFARSAVFPGVNEVRLVVADIFDVDQYASVLRYLSSLNSVTDVEVRQVENTRVTFLLQAHGGELAVSQAIALGRVLEAMGANSEYRLLP